VPAIVQKESPSFPRKRWPQAKVGEEVNETRLVPAKTARFIEFLRERLAPAG